MFTQIQKFTFNTSNTVIINYIFCFRNAAKIWNNRTIIFNTVHKLKTKCVCIHTDTNIFDLERLSVISFVKQNSQKLLLQKFYSLSTSTEKHRMTDDASHMMPFQATSEFHRKWNIVQSKNPIYNVLSASPWYSFLV